MLGHNTTACPDWCDRRYNSSGPNVTHASSSARFLSSTAAHSYLRSATTAPPTRLHPAGEFSLSLTSTQTAPDGLSTCWMFSVSRMGCMKDRFNGTLTFPVVAEASRLDRRQGRRVAWRCGMTVTDDTTFYPDAPTWATIDVCPTEWCIEDHDGERAWLPDPSFHESATLAEIPLTPMPCNGGTAIRLDPHRLAGLAGLPQHGKTATVSRSTSVTMMTVSRSAAMIWRRCP